MKLPFLSAAVSALDHFREEYNHERPHESLDQQTPAEFYVPSPRPYPLIVPEMTYPDDMIVRSVQSQGDISWKDRHTYLSKTLARELVGLRQVSDRLWDIYTARSTDGGASFIEMPINDRVAG